MYLLDTNVLSELRKLPAGRADYRVSGWARTIDGKATFLSAITILEIETGILRLDRYDGAQAAILRNWLETRVLRNFDRRILIIDTAVARRAAILHVPNPRQAHDMLIAATASVHGLTLATRNVADFAETGIRIVDPWAA